MLGFRPPYETAVSKPMIDKLVDNASSVGHIVVIA